LPPQPSPSAPVFFGRVLCAVFSLLRSARVPPFGAFRAHLLTGLFCSCCPPPPVSAVGRFRPGPRPCCPLRRCPPAFSHGGCRPGLAPPSRPAVPRSCSCRSPLLAFPPLVAFPPRLGCFPALPARRSPGLLVAWCCWPSPPGPSFRPLFPPLSPAAPLLASRPRFWPFAAVPSLLALLTWPPLFPASDQARGSAFLLPPRSRHWHCPLGRGGAAGARLLRTSSPRPPASAAWRARRCSPVAPCACCLLLPPLGRPVAATPRGLRSMQCWFRRASLRLTPPSPAWRPPACLSCRRRFCPPRAALLRSPSALPATARATRSSFRSSAPPFSASARVVVPPAASRLALPSGRSYPLSLPPPRRRRARRALWPAPARLARPPASCLLPSIPRSAASPGVASGPARAPLFRWRCSCPLSAWGPPACCALAGAPPRRPARPPLAALRAVVCPGGAARLPPPGLAAFRAGTLSPLLPRAAPPPAPGCDPALLRSRAPAAAACFARTRLRPSVRLTLRPPLPPGIFPFLLRAGCLLPASPRGLLDGVGRGSRPLARLPARAAPWPSPIFCLPRPPLRPLVARRTRSAYPAGARGFAGPPHPARQPRGDPRAPPPAPPTDVSYPPRTRDCPPPWSARPAAGSASRLWLSRAPNCCRPPRALLVDPPRLF